jgi:transcriptional regulator with XRE-family HTH domain
MSSQREIYAARFAEYVAAGLQRTGLKQAELARRAKVSPQLISQLANKKPHQLTDKLLLPERETVDRLARAFGDDPAIARAAAGYAPNPADAADIEADTEEILRTAFGMHGQTLSERDRATIYPFARALAEAARQLREK